MIIDSSALVAILLSEAECDRFIEKIEDASTKRMSIINYVETAMVLQARKGDEGHAALDRLVAQSGIEMVHVTAEMAKVVMIAFKAYGRGRHPAKLNFGDCFSYALAKSTNEPLLFKGRDFALTDVTPA